MTIGSSASIRFAGWGMLLFSMFYDIITPNDQNVTAGVQFATGILLFILAELREMNQ